MASTAQTSFRYESAVYSLLVTAALISLYFFNFAVTSFGVADAHFLWQARAFLHGRTDIDPAFISTVGPIDTVWRDGKYYWPLGPLPSLMFVPFVALYGPDMRIETVAHCLLAIAAALLSYRLARLRGLRPAEALWAALAFSLGSVMIGLLYTNGPWFFENLLTPTLLLYALIERETKNRPWRIGTIVALAAAARLPALLAATYFFILEIGAGKSFGTTFRRLAFMGAPIVAVLLMLGAFNAARFGNPFWTGQRDHYLMDRAYAERRDTYGVFNLINIPRNFSNYFLRPPALVDGLPLVEPRGVSVLLLSPAFFWLLAANPRGREFRAAAISSVLLLALTLSYFTDGSWQFGPRYLAEVTPLWYLVLIGVFRERGLGRVPKFVIAASAALNLELYWIFFLHFVAQVL